MDEQKLKLWSEVKHFKPQEFDSPDKLGSGLDGMNVEFVRLLDKLREKCGFPFKINSGYRTPEHNAKVGGKDESAHTLGVACDINCASSGDRDAILRYSFELGIKRRGLGDTFVHLDLDFTKPQNVTWIYPKGAKG